ncbi:MAG: glutathione S-transferase family protein [Gammaproteobacteria bacterium]|jgi:glutathione S-transferase|nr:glutathione S-transferase family protein [Gammaproteobacteria bacterium]MBT5155662.1 glutathione S-transferase family protein [Gammaproteobacteria bacterium]MBT5683507.1 glutathione S-transferase family protein [Gammaproteobacteria bacterium]MBT5724788.1 glutathione S-transferase family protein [Gammaproteobacteria bacterium]MBT6892302.1 glutathione S-transferase family protein [Gammaproteobacteria bacterium]
MKLFNSVGPNPKVVRMYMAERGIEVDLEEVDLMAGANRQGDYLKLNPGGQLPALELDNGDVIAEITCICEYLDDKDGGTSLIGTTPEERAETRMWMRRIDLGILEPLANGFRYAEGQPIFKDRMTLIPHAASDLKDLAQEKITWLDGLMEGKEFVCGDRFTLADIMLFVFLEFGSQVGQPLNEANKNIGALYERIGSRSSAAA